MKPPPTHDRNDFRLLLASTRWAVHTFFISLRRRGLPSLLVEPISGDPAELAAHADELDAATVVALDVAVEPERGVALCEALHERRPALPVIALLCCPQGINPWHLQKVLDSGASVLDLQATLEEAVRALEIVARGASVLNVHLRRGHRTLLRDVLAGRQATR